MQAGVQVNDRCSQCLKYRITDNIRMQAGAHAQKWPAPSPEKIEIQRERYIRILVADGQGPSISQRKEPMYFSVHVQLINRSRPFNFLAISKCSIQ